MRPFAYVRASGTTDALHAAAHRAAEVDHAHIGAPTQYLAGGTNLLDLMKLDVMRPATLVDLAELRKEYGGIEADGSGLRLGALVHMAEAADHPVIRQDYPVIADALRLAASQQLRNMATLGGNVLQRTRCPYFRDPGWAACNKRTPGSGCAAREGVNRRLAVLGVSEHCIASYPGDFANALLALGAEVEIAGPDGTNRRIPFEALHCLPGETPHVETTLRPGELITRFHVPSGPWTRRSLYLKIRDRQSYDFALAAAAVALHLDNGVVQQARVALGGVAAKPWRSHAAEGALNGNPFDEEHAEQAAAAAFQGAVTHTETAFKPELGRRTLVRALLTAAAMEI